MRNMLKNMIQGMRQALQLMPSQRAYIVNDGGFAQDAIQLRADFQRVSQDMNKAINRGEQTNYRTS
ncbi:hypothetical protein [Agitococcus lubricus]|uniref:Uncharacterized protein n=1 Tax=Agitococcus lubricus TaxID=1077255 RepID=A0A2T5IYQ4_9GAMM|nr:hypothetical protein [Agitococcus lubricus]PTQ89140.1 hypothetical protein C8N29_10821 [Agitococcus lubricus]